MGANRTRFLANRRLQPLGHLSRLYRIIPELRISVINPCPAPQFRSATRIVHTENALLDFAEQRHNKRHKYVRTSAPPNRIG
jgi:hypothetical protein